MLHYVVHYIHSMQVAATTNTYVMLNGIYNLYILYGRTAHHYEAPFLSQNYVISSIHCFFMYIICVSYC